MPATDTLSDALQAPADAPLAGVTVVEVGGGFAAAFAGRLLAAYGAVVVKVSEAGDARENGPEQPDAATAAYLDAGKLGVAMDATSPAGAALLESLSAAADVVVSFLSPDAATAPAQLATDGPIRVDISWFGRTGPWSNYLCDDFLAQHASGMAFTSALRMEDTTTSGPRAVPGHLAEMAAGLAAATATMVALTGRAAGHPPERVDISVAESLVSFMRYETVIYSYGWGLPSRSKLARSPVAAPVFQQKTADGFVDMLLMQEAPWRALLEILGSPAWGDEEIFATHPSRSQYWDALEPLLQEELQRTATATLYEQGQRKGVAIAPVNTIAQAASAEQFAGRGFFTHLPGESGLRAPGRPFQFGEAPEAGPAPLPGQHNRLVLAEWLGASPEELRAAGVAE